MSGPLASRHVAATSGASHRTERVPRIFVSLGPKMVPSVGATVAG
jgi:hypothetical protein